MMWCVGGTALWAADEREKDEIRAVFRISKQYLNDVIGREEIVANLPYSATIVGFHCTGVAHGRGTVSLDMQESTDAAVFFVDSQGNGQSCVKGVRGPFVAIGPAWGPFTSRTVVTFDGRTFAHRATTPWACVHGQLQRVTGRRDRRLGQRIGACIQPLGERLVPRAEMQGMPVAERLLGDFVEDLADRIVAKLNEKTPIEESVNRLFPQTKDWIFHMSADDQFIQAAYGPPTAQVPELPELEDPLEDVRIEAWLHTTGEEARLLSEISKQPLARQLVQKYLERTLPRLAALAEKRTVTAVGEWIVISIGAPDPGSFESVLSELLRDRM
jgi:hypothetical protein